MTKISIISEDKILAQDGVGYVLPDFSQVPTNIHALQWDETKGEIEFYLDENDLKLPNEKITEIPLWVNALILQWEVAKKLKEDEDIKRQIELDAIDLVAKQMQENNDLYIAQNAELEKQIQTLPPLPLV